MGNQHGNNYQQPNSSQQNPTVAVNFERRKYLAQRRLKQNYYREYGYSAEMGQRGTQGGDGKLDGLNNNHNGGLSATIASPKEDFDSPISLAFATTATHKGLSNNSGENNCFLNATMQALWHLGPFRVELQDFVASHQYLIDAAPGSDAGTDPSSSSSGSYVDSSRDGDVSVSPASPGGVGKDHLLRALCKMFNQYEHGTDAVVSPDELRNVIGQLNKQFHVGNIADANEMLEVILERIHSEWSPSCTSLEGHKCVGHTVFGGLLMEQAVCQVRSRAGLPT